MRVHGAGCRQASLSDMSAKVIYTDEEKDSIISLYEQGYALLYIRKKLGIAQNTLRRMLVEWRVYRSQSKIADTEKICTDTRVEQRVVKLFHRGFKLYTIERLTGLKKKAVSVILNRFGLKHQIPKSTQRLYSRRYLDKLKKEGRKPCYDKEKTRVRGQRYKAEHKEHLRSKARKRYQERKSELNRRARERRKTDPAYHIMGSLRNRVYRLLVHGDKAASTIELIGCSKEFLVRHLEKQFKTVELKHGVQFTMTWANYGPQGWHIDHITPCAAFYLTKPEEQRKCFHWSNLRPLYSTHNISRRFNTFFQQYGLSH